MRPGQPLSKQLATALLLGAAMLALPAPQAHEQLDPLGGDIFGGAGGAIIGGAVGCGRGAAIGAVIGATTGAVIAAEAQRRHGYYWYRATCYRQRADGAYVVVSPHRCGF